MGLASRSQYPVRHLSVLVPWDDDCRWDQGDLNAGFMASDERPISISPVMGQRKYRPSQRDVPPYTLFVKPMRYMNTDQIGRTASSLFLDENRFREDGNERTFRKAENQRVVLDAFARFIEPGESLVFVYSMSRYHAGQRVIVGVGLVTDRQELKEYDRVTDDVDRVMVWERPVQHSIANGGVLMPYSIIEERAANGDIADPSAYYSLVPSGLEDSFRYDSEHVKDGAAIATLHQVRSCLDRIEHDLGTSTQPERQWIDSQVERLSKVRGRFPGFGAVLTEMGAAHGLWLAHTMRTRVDRDDDPWESVESGDAAIQPGHQLSNDFDLIASKWQHLTTERKGFLRALSRIEISVEQGTQFFDRDRREEIGCNLTDSEATENPYRLFECSRRHRQRCIRLLQIDQAYGEESERAAYRLRAMAVEALEIASNEGHTWMDIGELLGRIRDLPVAPKPAISRDDLEHFLCDDPEVKRINDRPCLARYEAIATTLEGALDKLLAKRHRVDEDWTRFFPNFAVGSEELTERVHALRELAESGFCALYGSAGSGKTTLLKHICAIPSIKDRGILLLAPTGKARVRLNKETGEPAKTVAQYLISSGRYNADAGVYQRSDEARDKCGTIIIDEASMLTEEMLDAVLDAVDAESLQRLILVGDPGQLPPIGAGKPFVDIIERLGEPSNRRGFAELTVNMRQVGGTRDDVDLAQWFAYRSPGELSDAVFYGGDSERLVFHQWNDESEFVGLLKRAVDEEVVRIAGQGKNAFDKSLGGNGEGKYAFFAPGKSNQDGSAPIENWQILAPNRLTSGSTSTKEINRTIHDWYRKEHIKLTRAPDKAYKEPLGDEDIVFNDKVINVVNSNKRYSTNDQQDGYVANGEIGCVLYPKSEYLGRKYDKLGNQVVVAFSSQLEKTYLMPVEDDQGRAVLELAYALAVHKAQGSQFGTVILVLPEQSTVLSRELIYTALTRHTERVVILHQGGRNLLHKLSQQAFSELAKRNSFVFAGGGK